MIYTVTVNPSLDYVVEVNSFELGMTNRTVSEKIVPGGKGINVSMVLKKSGIYKYSSWFCSRFYRRRIGKKLGRKGNLSEIHSYQKWFYKNQFEITVG